MSAVRLGLRANRRQFALLVALNALVGGMVGLERSVLPLVGQRDFALRSSSAILAFVVAFGAAKALTNLAAGDLAERIGRKRLLVLGWLVALPVPLLIGLAPSWWFVVAANLLLGANQGLAWSMTVVMKIDLAGPRRRGLALGLNEAAGYLGLAATAFATGALAAAYAPRTIVWAGAAVLAAVGLLGSVFAVRDTAEHVAREQREQKGTAPGDRGLRDAFARASLRDPTLRACSQAGLVNNLNDALVWGLAPLYLAAHGASVRQVAVVAGAYPLVWGVGQLATGWLSDRARCGGALMILGAREPAELAWRAEEHPQLPPGTCERVSGYGVMSLPFRSSAGEPFTSIWHRDAAGRRTFYGSARSEVACTRYSGAGVERVRLGPAGPLAEQAHPTDFSMPQRGVSAVGRVFLTPITEVSR